MIDKCVLPTNDYRNFLMHYGVDHLHSKSGLGSGRYPYGSKNNSVFVSGSSKTQDETSKYYRKELPKP